MKPLRLATLSVLLLVLPATADEASRRETVVRILEVTQARQAVDQVMQIFDSSLSSQIASLDLDSEGREAAARVRNEMMSLMSTVLTWAEMEPFMIEMYSDVFTEDELVGLLEFYESELGQKMIGKQPEIVQRSSQWAQQKVQARMPEIQRRIQTAIQELESEYSAGSSGGE